MNSTRADAYKFIDHTFDVVVVGAGGRLRAIKYRERLTTACITKVFPTRSHTLQPADCSRLAISAKTVGNAYYDTVKGSTARDQMRESTCCRRPSPLSSWSMRMPFSPLKMGNLSKPFVSYERFARIRFHARAQLPDRTDICFSTHPYGQAWPGRFSSSISCLSPSW